MNFQTQLVNKPDKPFIGLKECYIVNSQFCWILRVDDVEIPFQGSDAAEYFEKHYRDLGYKIIHLDEQVRPRKYNG